MCLDDTDEAYFLVQVLGQLIIRYTAHGLRVAEGLSRGSHNSIPPQVHVGFLEHPDHGKTAELGRLGQAL